MKVRWLNADEEAWDELVRRSAHADFFHSSGYHLWEAKRTGGRPIMMSFELGADFIAVPSLLHPCPGKAGLLDAISVYGYTGPLCSRTDMPSDALGTYRAMLARELREAGVVSLFSRLHPLFAQRQFCAELGEVRKAGETVSVDVRASEAECRRDMRASTLRQIRRSVRLGVTVFEDAGCARLDEFAAIYHETMSRVGAGASYEYDAADLADLRDRFGDRVRLLFGMVDGKLVAGALFLESRGLFQYFLGGTLTEALGLSPMGVLFFEARRLFSGMGHTLHLGGGVGGKADTLLQFKRGFSSARHDFLVWRWIVDPDRYQALCRRAGVREDDPFFPAYRRGGERQTLA